MSYTRLIQVASELLPRTDWFAGSLTIAHWKSGVDMLSQKWGTGRTYLRFDQLSESISRQCKTVGCLRGIRSKEHEAEPSKWDARLAVWGNSRISIPPPQRPGRRRLQKQLRTVIVDLAHGSDFIYTVFRAGEIGIGSVQTPGRHYR